MSILPTAFLVRYRIPLLRLERLPGSGKQLMNLPEAARLAAPSHLDRLADPVELRGVWNPHGLAFSLRVTGRTMPVFSRPDDPTRPDSFELWLDTRDTQTVHRATRFCHHLAVLPTGGGPRGLDPSVSPLPVARAREDAPLPDPDDFLIHSRLDPDGYQLDIWIPAAALNGFDPVTQPRLGFCCCINDAELGRMPWGVGEGFPFDSDPSLWHTLELRDT